MKDIYKKPIKIVSIGIIVLIISFFIDNLFLEYSAALIFPFAEYFFSFLTDIIFVIIVLLVYPTIMMWHENKGKWIIPLWAAFWIAVLFSIVLKMIVQRSRPIEVERLFNFLIYSFPSTHTTCAFAVLPILNYVFKKQYWLWYTIIILIAVSRLYLHYHYLSDVLAGALIGYTLGWAAIHLKERYL